MRIILRLYAHKIAPIIDGKVTNVQFKAIGKCEEVAQSLARMFNGETDCSTCGTVQYSDTLVFNNISQEHVKFILDCHPFIGIVTKRWLD